MKKLEVGQVWEEVYPGYIRHVEIVGFCDKTGKVLIKGASRVTRAKPERFNGKTGGYAFVR